MSSRQLDEEWSLLPAIAPGAILKNAPRGNSISPIRVKDGIALGE